MWKAPSRPRDRAAGAEAVETKLVSRGCFFSAEATLQECFERNAEGMLKNMAIHEIALACQFWGMRADNVTDVICNAKGGKDSPGCDMRRAGGKTDFAWVDVTLVNEDGHEGAHRRADRCSGGEAARRW